MEDSLLSYVHVPPGAHRVPGPSAGGAAYRARLASFPPAGGLSSSAGSGAGGKDNKNASKTGKDDKAGGGYLANSVSDMFLSSILPSSIPSRPNIDDAGSTAPGLGGSIRLGPGGKPRPLTSQREPLSLQAMTNTFRRFVARCGPVFWVLDRVEEVIYWRKPVWTLAWCVGWGFLSFYPRLFLVLPFVVISLILLHQYEKSHPSISSSTSASGSSGASAPVPAPGLVPPSRNTLLGNPATAALAADLTQNADPSRRGSGRDEEDTIAHGSTVDEQGREVPAAPPGAAESTVDYYMNLQGIQNLMGLVSDLHDALLPYVSLVNPTSAPSAPPPTSFPLSATHILMLCLPPAFFLPLAPGPVISWTLFLAGLAPPVLFHPALTPDRLRALADRLLLGGDGKSATGGRGLRYLRAKVERWVLTDRLDDRIANSEIREVNVWEHERVERAWIDKAQAKVAEGKSRAGGDVPIPPGSAWSAANLTVADRQPWVRTIPLNTESLWKDDGPRATRGRSSPLAAMALGHTEGDDEVALEAHGTNGRVALLLQKEWSFVPGEEWRVDFAGGWSPVGVDEDGWVYSDDDWQNIAPVPVVQGQGGTLIFKTTRRRQWWRRVVHG